MLSQPQIIVRFKDSICLSKIDSKNCLAYLLCTRHFKAKTITRLVCNLVYYSDLGKPNVTIDGCLNYGLL